MRPEEKILKVLKVIQAKADISPGDAVLDYRAGHEDFDLLAADEIAILNKLVEEKVIKVEDNFASEYI